MHIVHPLPQSADPLQSLKQQVAQWVMDKLDACSARPALILLSGGSAMGIYDYLAEALRQSPRDGSKWIWGMADDRYDNANNNFLDMKIHHPDIMQVVSDMHGVFLDTSPHQPDQYRMAEWYDQQMHAAVSATKQDGKILVVLGMGTDGHTAGIMPFPDDAKVFRRLFMTPDTFVVGYDATGKNPFSKRFTVTYPLLELTDSAVVYVTGEAKRLPLKQALSGSLPFWELPGSLFYTIADRITLATDLENLN